MNKKLINYLVLLKKTVFCFSQDHELNYPKGWGGYFGNVTGYRLLLPYLKCNK